MDKALDVLIIGGGIGGLATALSLHDIGLRPRIFEQAKEIRPLGVGINLLPHSVRELTELGLLKELNATGVEIDELRFYTQYGLEIQREPRGTKARYKWPQFSINRGELQMLLYRAVLERLGPDCIKTAHTAADVTQDNDKVSVSFKNSATGESLTTEPADIVIAADGVHSIIRKKYYPDEG
ncbi:MAG: FAD-dependent monooxygenase, partial [Rhodospirillales bacterium]